MTVLQVMAGVGVIVLLCLAFPVGCFLIGVGFGFIAKGIEWVEDL